MFSALIRPVSYNAEPIPNPEPSPRSIELDEALLIRDALLFAASQPTRRAPVYGELVEQSVDIIDKTALLQTAPAALDELRTIPRQKNRCAKKPVGDDDTGNFKIHAILEGDTVDTSPELSPMDFKVAVMNVIDEIKELHDLRLKLKEARTTPLTYPLERRRDVAKALKRFAHGDQRPKALEEVQRFFDNHEEYRVGVLPAVWPVTRSVRRAIGTAKNRVI